jgi:membrane-associated phospholipid phosphatase
VSSAALFPRAGETFGGAAEWIAHRLRRLPVVLVSLVVAGVGALLLAGMMVTLGLFTSEALLSVSTIAQADADFPLWLASHRTPLLADTSSIASKLADAPVLVPLVGAFVFALALGRRWMRATFLALAALVEVWGYLLTKGFVQWRTMDTAPHESFPWNSFPAGHVAAAIAIYGALAFVLSAHFNHRWARAAVWATATAIVLAAAASRMYRGEHHLLDVAGGAAMGIGALVVALLAEQIAHLLAAIRAKPGIGEVTQ